MRVFKNCFGEWSQAPGSSHCSHRLAGRSLLLHGDYGRAGRTSYSFLAHAQPASGNRSAQEEMQCSDFNPPGGELERIRAIHPAGVGMQKRRHDEPLPSSRCIALINTPNR